MSNAVQALQDSSIKSREATCLLGLGRDLLAQGKANHRDGLFQVCNFGGLVGQ
jgi:hypothetical protein